MSEEISKVEAEVETLVSDVKAEAEKVYEWVVDEFSPLVTSTGTAVVVKKEVVAETTETPVVAAPVTDTEVVTPVVETPVVVEPAAAVAEVETPAAVVETEAVVEPVVEAKAE